MKNKFRDFVWNTIDEVMEVSDLPTYQIDIAFHKKPRRNKGEDSAITADINILPEYQSCRINIYKELENLYNEGQQNRVVDVLCHEVGHIHSRRLAKLIDEPYKTEREAIEADDEISTKIGNYLYRLLDKNKLFGEKKCYKKPQRGTNKKQKTKKSKKH